MTPMHELYGIQQSGGGIVPPKIPWVTRDDESSSRRGVGGGTGRPQYHDLGNDGEQGVQAKVVGKD